MLWVIGWFFGYLAIPHTIWANKVVYGSPGAIFMRKAIISFIFWIVLVPWWIIKAIMSK